MKRNYKLLLQTKGIEKYFKPYSKLDIYDSDTMKSHLQVKWKEFSYEDLKLMDETIEKDINNSNLINSLLGLGISILISLAVGYAAIRMGFKANDAKIDKVVSLISVSLFIVTLTTLVGITYIQNIRLKKN
ncbi:hypothetical protein [Lysinibacillus fusiformis]|uniref:hypothetical protein n=2 Tax=Lysinibacillus fusiformis TaxID=28031 RepID=UPI00088AF96A|nr:hypothetical protein [Lysinibacillus fusiformis]MCG7437596.1 hypothetical protein [Lysinibacillus fusiformis]SCX69516.1 hypothetical protein SAMN02787108_04563 [Lysinibacillus fusiformis]SDB58283.1 hypothetical protein SAMN02787070_04550 [Lysinibacillus fusiformis]SFJ18323.1 hypothetical protein SAMN02787080_04570 [Lysinibacillus fusiformis]SFT29240.1 hypothetical protein SAMN02787099_04459 [Lysinibacillus fusiformis]